MVLQTTTTVLTGDVSHALRTSTMTDRNVSVNLMSVGMDLSVCRSALPIRTIMVAAAFHARFTKDGTLDLSSAKTSALKECVTFRM